MLDWLEALVGRRARCLDLGCGTGAVSERLLARFPRARSTGVDFDPVLLRLGATGLGSVRGRMRWVDADLRTPNWAAALPRGRYDAALSSTALHWLTGSQLAQCYRETARRLRPGGVLLNADHLAFPLNAVRLRAAARDLRHAEAAPARSRSERMAESWTQWWKEVARDPALRSELTLRSQRFPLEHAGTPTPDLGGHRARLLRAGFREVEVVWSQGESRVLAAFR
jgi:SAM-dependent methyltransferase